MLKQTEDQTRNMMEETIAAIATPYGEGGIGIVRISGQKSKDIMDQIFIPVGGEELSIENRRFYYGQIREPKGQQIIDEVLCVFMKGPSTYTREDVVEVYCHGSVVSLRNTLSLVLRNGARLALPGEFTKRAFLNGRIDLSQAEAVIDLIKAKTEKSFDIALHQMEGHLSKRVRGIRQLLMDLLVKIAVNIDYSEEDIEELSHEELLKSILQIDDTLTELLSTAKTGRMIREGLAVAIVGKPNVGKSSLLNALLRESRAIVTEIPGTTRDTIEEVLNIEGIPVYITDTAGIRDTQDPIEQIGIGKSKEAAFKADLVLFILDGSKPLEGEDLAIAKQIGGKRVIVLLNKSDLGRDVSEDQLANILPQAIFLDTAVIEERGIKELEDEIVSLVFEGKVKQEQSDLITNVRQQDLLIQAKEALTDAKDMTLAKEPMDFIEVDIRHAWELLGDILGETVSEEIVNEVFARFCLGK